MKREFHAVKIEHRENGNENLESQNWKARPPQYLENEARAFGTKRIPKPVRQPRLFGKRAPASPGHCCPTCLPQSLAQAIPLTIVLSSVRAHTSRVLHKEIPNGKCKGQINKVATSKGEDCKCST